MLTGTGAVTAAAAIDRLSLATTPSITLASFDFALASGVTKEYVDDVADGLLGTGKRSLSYLGSPTLIEQLLAAGGTIVRLQYPFT